MTQQPLHFTIPGRPTTWQRATEMRHPKTGKIIKVTPADMRKAQASIKGWCAAAMAGRAHLEGPLRLEVLCVYDIPASWDDAKQQAAKAGLVWKTSVPDWDNLAKQIGDALNGTAYRDDATIVRASVAKRYGSPERTEVRLVPMGVFSSSTPTAVFRAWLREREGQTRLQIMDGKASNTQSGAR